MLSFKRQLCFIPAGDYPVRMSAKWAPLLVVLCACSFWSLPVPAAGLPSKQQVLEMVNEDRFDELEKLTSELRGKKLEFYNGFSDLSRVYGYLEGVSRKADDAAWQQYIGKLEAWSKAYPDSPTPRIALGNVYISYAWKARGGGYANTVGDEGWRLFGERLDKAREYLDAAGKIPVKDAEVYRALIVVVMGQGGSRKDMEAVFQKGIELEPNYQQLYEAKAYYLLPRWHGRQGEWEAFVLEAADARGGEEGDILYMAIARSQAWSEGADFFRNTRISYGHMKRGFEASLRRNPEYVWEMNSYCYFACIAGDRATAKQLFQKINGRWEQEVWSKQDLFQQWQNWATNNGRVPIVATRTRPVRPLLTSDHIKSALLITGAVWLVLVLIIAVVVWLVVRNHQKSR